MLGAFFYPDKLILVGLVFIAAYRNLGGPPFYSCLVIGGLSLIRSICLTSRSWLKVDPLKVESLGVSLESFRYPSVESNLSDIFDFHITVQPGPPSPVQLSP